MALLLPLEDEEFWRGLLEADAEFRACVERIVGDLEVSIDVPALEASFSLSASIDLRISGLKAELQKITDDLPCIDIIIKFLQEQENPEAAAFREAMEAQKALLESQKLSIESQLEVLPAFSASTKEQTDNLITTGKNASFLGGILDSLSPSEGG